MNIGGGTRVTLLDALAMLEQALGLKAKLSLGHTQAGDVRDTWADLGRAHAVLGYAPRTTAAEGLAREAAWIRDVYSERMRSCDPA
jgi:UDP-glucuronate 4-epimerase